MTTPLLPGPWTCVYCGRKNPGHRFYCLGCPRRKESSMGAERGKWIMQVYESTGEDGMTAKQIAERLGLSPSRVLQLYSKARLQALKEAI